MEQCDKGIIFTKNPRGLDKVSQSGTLIFNYNRTNPRHIDTSIGALFQMIYKINVVKSLHVIHMTMGQKISF